MRIVLVAGEASGDQLGSGLIRALRARYPQIECAGIGGPQMAAAGLQLWYPAERLSVMGLDALKRIIPLLKMRGEFLRRIRDYSPDAYIGIDAPDFNLSIERKLKRRGVLTMHYVSPTIWAWRGYRIRRIIKSAHKILVLFPFEEALYLQHDVPAVYVGHLMADQIPLERPYREWKEKLRLTRASQVVAMLPGSRRGEVQRLMPTMIEVMQKMLAKDPRRVFLWPCASKEIHTQLQQKIWEHDIPAESVFLYHAHARQALMAADAALVTSGTASLEAALCQCPMVITYKISAFGEWLVWRLLYLPWVGLPNILAGYFLVPELLGVEATPDNLAQAMENMLALEAPRRQRMQDVFRTLHQQLQLDANQRAAIEVGRLLKVEP